MKKRIWEIDFIRGIAIVLMVIFHLVFDLSEFYSYNFDYLKGFWYYEGKISAIMFMIVSGISITLGGNAIKRGLQIFGFGMLLTLITYFVSPKEYIVFGILHFMGISMILYHYIKKLDMKFIFILALLILYVGYRFESMTTNVPFLFPFGLMTSNFVSLDYYPLLPYFGFFLIGTILGKLLYREKRSLFTFELNNNPLSLMGRHSLLIYLVHQPLTLGILYLVHAFN
jgi:uncharacterized membrane protein